MVGDEAIAWAEYGTPDELPNIHHSKQYLAEADVTPDYRITCIFVDKRYRKHGYAKVALVCPGDRAVGILESRALMMRRSSCRGGTRSSSVARCSI